MIPGPRTPVGALLRSSSEPVSSFPVMKSRLRDFFVGVTSIVALTGFAALLLLFGELASLWQKRYPLHIRANESAGLRAGSQVTLNGVVIGTVESIDVSLDDVAHPVRIRAFIQERFDVPLGVTPSVSISLLGGGQRLDLQVPADPSVQLVMASRTQVSEIVADFETLGDVIRYVKSAVEEARGTLARLEGGFENAGKTFEKVGGTLDDISTLSKQAGQTLAKADAWLGDEQLREDFRGALFNAREATATIARVVANFEGDAPKLMGSLTRAGDQLSRSLEQLDQLLAQAREGKGTVGQLMSNPDLYNNLNDASQRLTSLLRQAQLLLEKIRQEGLDVKF